MEFNRKTLFSYRRIIGTYFVLAGILIALRVIFPEVITLLVAALSILLILSVDFIIRGLKIKKHFGFVPTGISVALASILGLLIILLNWNIEKIWPLFGFCASLGFIISFFITDKRKMSLLITGIFLALMSSLILCFTTDFINLNSKYLLFFSVALLLMFSGILMICQTENTKPSGNDPVQPNDVQQHIDSDNKDKSADED